MRHWKPGIINGSATREETSPLNSSLDLKATKTTGRVGSFMRGKPAQKVVVLAFRGLITTDVHPYSDHSYSDILATVTKS